MPDKIRLFDPEKISIIDFKLVKGQIDTSEAIENTGIEGYHVDNGLQLGFNLEDKLIKADFTIQIKTKSKGKVPNESSGSFHLVFIYKVDNLNELAIPTSDNLLKLDPDLGNALSAITYSTARGILLTRLQGTAFQDFILPIINPNNLLNNN
jgi:hypothetical protein